MFFYRSYGNETDWDALTKQVIHFYNFFAYFDIRIRVSLVAIVLYIVKKLEKICLVYLQILTGLVAN